MVRQYNDQRKRTNNGVEKTNTSVSHWRPLIEWDRRKYVTKDSIMFKIMTFLYNNAVHSVICEGLHF